MLKCDQAIYTNDRLNAYEIDFNKPSEQTYCKLIESESRLIRRFMLMIDNYETFADQLIEEVFEDKNAKETLEGSLMFL